MTPRRLNGPLKLLRRQVLRKLPEPERVWANEALRQWSSEGRPYGVSTAQAIFALAHGFLPAQYHVLGLGDADRRRRLINDLQRERINRYQSTSTPTQDKLLVSLLFSDLAGGGAPSLLGVVAEGHFTPVGRRQSGLSGLLALLDDGAVVLKPSIDTGGGRGVVVLQGTSTQPCAYGKPVTRRYLETLLRAHKRSVVVAYAHQADYVERVTPGHASNLRLLTVRDALDRPYLAWAAHEFVTAASAPSHHFGQGGLSVDIDVRTGRLAAGVQLTVDRRVTWYANHPDTGARIEGLVVPNWDRVRNVVLDIATRAPQLRCAGWDVIVTDDGPVVLEGEAHALTSAVQVNRPILSDPVVRDFFIREGHVKA